jgi:hypothetical protein
MNNKITIYGYDISKNQIGAFEYRVSVFLADKLEFQFNVSLEPTGKDDLLPTYQVTDKSKTIPTWTRENLNIISGWITKEGK